MIEDSMLEIFPLQAPHPLPPTPVPILWCIKDIQAGPLRLISAYPRRANYPSLRRQGISKTGLAQKKVNLRNTKEKLLLLLFTNFHIGDLLVTLTFIKEPKDREQALACFRYFLKKLRIKVDNDIKYIAVLERHNHTGDEVRCHFHVVFSGVDFEMVKNCWTYGLPGNELDECPDGMKAGRKDIKVLNDLSGAADYLCKTMPYMPEGEHHYFRSKNLEEPVKEIKKLDTRNMDDMDELDSITKYPRKYTEVFFPEYEMESEPEIRESPFMPGLYVSLTLKKTKTKENAAERKRYGFLKKCANDILEGNPQTRPRPIQLE